MDTQPVEEMRIEVETGNSPSLDPVTADTAEHCADSPGQPAESANLDATSSVPKNTRQEETTDDVKEKEGTDKTVTPANSQEEPANQEPEVKVKENTISTQTSEDPAGDNMEPVKDPQGATAETANETEELEDGETPAKKPKVANEEEATSNPKKVFCEE